jgi:serine/threonine protein kinase
LENILFDKNSFKIKLIDFGFSYHEKKNSKKNLKNFYTSIALGTKGYMSPELLNNTDSDLNYEKNDNFALGVIIFTIMCGMSPFE